MAGQRKIVEGGVELHFEPADDVPGALVTSAGISYADHCLRLRKAYMNRSPCETVAAVEKLWRGR